MKLLDVSLLTACVILVSGGQLLFKLASENFRQLENMGQITTAIFSPQLLSALVIYAFATLMWVWLLRDIPLTRAYPFLALSFVIVPLLSALLLGETVGLTYFVGIALIVGGIVVISI